MKKIIIGILAVLLSGCGSGVGNYFVPTEFQPYVSSFESASGMRIKSIRIRFGDTGSNSFEGYCNTGNSEILIREEYWNQIGTDDKELLVWHEIGHCYLNRNHLDTYESDLTGIYPTSIMKSTLIPTSDFVKHRAWYISELVK